MDRLPKRKRPAHFSPVASSNRATIVFLTVCTNARRPVLANPAAHCHLRETWTQANRWRVGRDVLMPDHVHLFCSPGEWPPPPLSHWVRFWKSRAAAAWPQPQERTLWQRDWWDTQLRAEESYAAKWSYVRNNPVRAGLVESAEDWPYQGELNTLEWHD